MSIKETSLNSYQKSFTPGAITLFTHQVIPPKSFLSTSIALGIQSHFMINVLRPLLFNRTRLNACTINPNHFSLQEVKKHCNSFNNFMLICFATAELSSHYKSQECYHNAQCRDPLKAISAYRIKFDRSAPYFSCLPNI